LLTTPGSLLPAPPSLIHSEEHGRGFFSRFSIILSCFFSGLLSMFCFLPCRGRKGTFYFSSVYSS
jgi:hypothetical protein